MTVVDWLEWGGSLTGIAGALMLATYTSVSRFGWWAYLMANVLMISFAIMIEKNGLLLQQVCFMCTSLLGLYRSWWKPAKDARSATR